MTIWLVVVVSVAGAIALGGILDAVYITWRRRRDRKRTLQRLA